MARVASGQVSVSIGMDPEAVEQLRQFCAGNGVSQGAAVAALLGSWERLRAAEEAAEADRAEAARLRAEAQATNEKARVDASGLEQREAKLSALEEAYRRGYSLTQQAIELLKQLVDSGVGKAEIMDLAEVLGAAGVSAREAADAIRRMGGVQHWVAQTQKAVDQLQKERQQADVELRARRQAKALLEHQIEEYAAVIDQAKQRMSQADAYVSGVMRQAEDMGVALAIAGSWSGGHVQDLDMDLGRAVAGAILMTLVETRGDDIIAMPANFAAGRMMPMQVPLSEIPYLLAPREAYDSMRRTMARQSAMAEVLANGRMEGEGDAEPE